MENIDKGIMLLQAARLTQSMGMNTGVRLDPEQEQQEDSEPDTRPESNQGSLEPGNGPPPQALIEFRIQQLQNRRFLLQKLQHFKKKAKDNSGWTTEEMASEDSDKLYELEAIQKELEELEEQRKSSNLSQQEACPSFYKTETPRGGIYMLPPPALRQEDVTPERRANTTPAAEKPTDSAVAADSLGQTPAVTQCPSCREVIFTETHSTVGKSMWELVCLCAMSGCFAGCCLMPFFIDHLKSVHHHCPQCQAHIHTYRPF